MRLWTWHEHNWSLLSGVVDPRRSDYYNSHPGIPPAYGELGRRLRTNQFIWCFVRRENRTTVDDGRQEWELEVPDSEILCFVDDLIWNRLIGIRCGLPQSLRLEIKKRAIEKHPYEPKKSHAYQDELTEAYWNEPAPQGGWWAELLSDVPRTDEATALIRHPVDAGWVVSIGGARR